MLLLFINYWSLIPCLLCCFLPECKENVQVEKMHGAQYQDDEADL